MNRDMVFKVGDEVWWFKVGRQCSYVYTRDLVPDSIELVHDIITCIDGDSLVCWHSTKDRADIWGKTRQEAWDRLKHSILCFTSHITPYYFHFS